jgi:outer membrane immunogenic protein
MGQVCVLLGAGVQKLTAGMLVIAAFAAPSAFAADIAVPSTPYFAAPPPPRPVFSWTGCYLGAHFGGGWGDQQFNGGPFVDPVVSRSGGGSPLSMSLTSGSFDGGSGGVLGGGQAGCDLEFAGPWVAGFAVDGAWANISGNQGHDQTLAFDATLFPSVTSTVASTGTLEEKTNTIATVTARFGYSFGGGLLYVKGGGAWDRTSYRFYGQVCGANGGACVFVTPFNFTTSTDTRWGWTVGVGTEWIIVGNWSIFGEYNFLDFGTKDLTFTDATMGQAVFSVRHYINEVKGGINFRFY